MRNLFGGLFLNSSLKFWHFLGIFRNFNEEFVLAADFNEELSRHGNSSLKCFNSSLKSLHSSLKILIPH